MKSSSAEEAEEAGEEEGEAEVEEVETVDAVVAVRDAEEPAVEPRGVALLCGRRGGYLEDGGVFAAASA